MPAHLPGMSHKWVCVALLLSACGQGTPGRGQAGPRWPPARTGYVNPIIAENQLAGDVSWNQFTRSVGGQGEAYAERVSAKAGESVQIMARSSAAAGASWTLYRVGWYGGAGARQIGAGTAQLGPQPACANEAATGLVRCSWAPTFSLAVPEDAVSGLYLVRIVRDDKVGAFVPLVVRDGRQADLLFQSSVLTAQAYNNWGGEGLYSDSDDHVPGGFAVQVSFDRPHDSDGGSGQVLRYEALMARFLERYGYDVTYTTNLDVMREGPSALLRRGAFLSVGHDEYDRTFLLDAPGRVTVVARSPVVDAEGRTSFSEATMYTAPSGALVFGAGTIYFARGLDGPRRDPRVERMAANVLKLALGLEIPGPLQSPSAPAAPVPDPQWAGNVRTIASGMMAPAGVAQLPDGSFVVADASAHRIWRVDGTGSVRPFAGDGHEGGSSTYDNRPGLQARFFQPTAVLPDAAGNVYVADTHNNAIRKIANDSSHTVTTIAGALLVSGYADGPGSGARTQMQMGLIWSNGTLIASDPGNKRLRSILPGTTAGGTTVKTWAGSGLAGADDGPASTASFQVPLGLWKGKDGNVYLVDGSAGPLRAIQP